MTESRFERMQANSKPTALQELRQKLFRRPAWLNFAPRSNEEDDNTATCVVHSKPVGLTRAQELQHASGRIATLEARIEQLNCELEIHSRKTAMLQKLQSLSKTPWGAEESLAIKASLIELDAQLAAVKAKPAITVKSVLTLTAAQQGRLRCLVREELQARGTPWEKEVSKKVNATLKNEGLIDA